MLRKPWIVLVGLVALAIWFVAPEREEAGALEARMSENAVEHARVLLELEAVTPLEVARTSQDRRTQADALATSPRSEASLRGRVVLSSGVPWGESDTLADQQLEWSAPALRRIIGEGEAARATYDGNHAFELLAADGHFLLREMPTGVELLLEFTAPFGRWSMRVPPLAPGELRELDFVLGDEGRWRRLRGVVVDESDTPAEAVNLWLSPLASMLHSDGPATTSGSDGLFELGPVEPGRYRLRASGVGYALELDEELDLSGPDLEHVVLRITRGFALEGEVVWPDGSPVDFGVAVFGLVEGSIQEGVLQLRTVAPHPDRLRIETRSRGRIGRFDEVVRPGTGRARYVLRETPTQDLRVEVVDENGHFLHAEVAASFAGFHPWRDQANVTPLEGLGVWRVELPPGPAWLEVSSARHHPRTLELEVRGPETVRLELERATLLRGIVQDARGAPCAGASVYASGRAVNCAPDGSFAVFSTGVPTQLTAECAGHAPSEPLVVQPDGREELDGLVLRLREGCTLAGRVAGAPQDCEVVLAQDGEWIRAYALDADGTFEFTDLPRGSYAVHAECDAREGVAIAVELEPGRSAEVVVPAP